MKLKEFDTDFSRFFLRTNPTTERVPIPNIVKLVVGEHMFECSGCMIAQHSGILSEMITNPANITEVYLDEFVGCIEGFQHCIELMYGADIVITIENVQAMFKFSLLYKIPEMFGQCLEWVVDNLTMNNLLQFYEMGMFAKNIDIEQAGILAACKGFIMRNSANSLLELSKSWPAQTLNKIISFLFDKDLVRTTLPIITRWIDSEDKVSQALDYIMEYTLEEGLLKTVAQSVDMTTKMNECCETVANLKRVNSLQAKLLNAKAGHGIGDISSTAIGHLVLHSLEAKQWRKLWMYQLESLYALYKAEKNMFFYAEIALDWIRATKPLPQTVGVIWGNIRKEFINKEYLIVLRNTILAIDKDYSETVKDVVKSQCLNKYDGFQLSDANSKLLVIELKCLSTTEVPYYYQVRDCSVSNCTKKYEEIYHENFRLVDKLPCYEVIPTHDSEKKRHYKENKTKHWYATEEIAGRRVLVSFVTNTKAEVIDLIRNAENVLFYYMTAVNKGEYLHCNMTDREQMDVWL